MKILIIEFQTSGHYPEYLKHVLKKINQDYDVNNYIIFVTPYLKQHLESFQNTPIYKSIHFFDERSANLYKSFSNTKQMAGLIFSKIFKIKEQFEFGHVLFLNLNLVLRNYKLLNPFKKLPFNFSGILMNSPYRLREQNKDLLLLFKREFPLRLLAANKNCSSIFLLNDKKGVEFYRKWSDKINFVNDPVRITNTSTLDIKKYHNIKPLTKIFIQIGKLGTYKGTLDIIEAITKLNNKILDKAHFLFIGKINKNSKQEFDEHRKNLNSQIYSLRDEFISDDDFSAYLQQSDVVLITNKNVENSSGIVNHCLANKKLVIAPNEGYYKEVFKSYRAVVNYDNEFPLEKAILYTFENFEVLDDMAQNYDNQTFIESNSPERFAEILFKDLSFKS